MTELWKKWIDTQNENLTYLCSLSEDIVDYCFNFIHNSKLQAVALPYVDTDTES